MVELRGFEPRCSCPFSALVTKCDGCLGRDTDDGDEDHRCSIACGPTPLYCRLRNTSRAVVRNAWFSSSVGSILSQGRKIDLKQHSDWTNSGGKSLLIVGQWHLRRWSIRSSNVAKFHELVLDARFITRRTTVSNCLLSFACRRKNHGSFVRKHAEFRISRSTAGQVA
jgi:hypothetical protein